MARVGSFDESPTFERIPRRKRRSSDGISSKELDRLLIASGQASLNRCSKTAFPTKAHAERRMSQLIHNGTPVKHAYRCNACSQWHLTSMPKSESEMLGKYRSQTGCTRWAYFSYESALAALHERNARLIPGKRPFTGAYKCTTCGTYHLKWTPK